jgi:outer membrane lipoprotein carrier protein
MGSGKFWRRRRRLPTSLALVFSLAAAPFLSAQPSNAQADPGEQEAQVAVAESGVARLERFLSDVRSLSASFKQELWSADQELLQTDTGTLSLQRPNRFRWTYRNTDEPAGPAKLVVVADGTELWIYDVELEEVTVTPFEEVGTSPALLLSGDRSIREEFDVVGTHTLEGLDWIKLEPKGGSDFASVAIGFNGTEPRRLELVDGLGQVTRIELDDLVLNPTIDDDVFELDVPKDAHVIGGQG